MATPVHVPRVNNNDDSVLIVSLDVKERDFVKRGQIVGVVETDKAVVDVQAECDGYVLKVLGQLDENARVGAVLLWLGETADEPVPEQVTSATAAVAYPCAARNRPALAFCFSLRSAVMSGMVRDRF